MQVPFRTPGALSGLTIKVIQNNFTSAVTFKSRIGGVDGNQLVTVGAGLTGDFQDTTHTDNLAGAGELLSVMLTIPAQSGSFTYVLGSLKFLPTATTDTVVLHQALGAGTTAGASATHYKSLSGLGSTQTTESREQFKVKIAGTYKNLFVNIDTNTSTKTTTFRFRKNGANGNMNVAVAAGLTGIFEDTSNTDTVAVDDLVNTIATTLSGATGLITYGNVGVSFVGTAAKYHLICATHDGTSLNSNQTGYAAIAGALALISSTENDCKALAGIGAVLSNLEVRVITNTITASTTVRTRKNNANGAQTLTIGAGLTGVFEDTSNTDSVVATDYVNYQIVTPSPGGTAIRLNDFGVLVTPTTVMVSSSDSGVGVDTGGRVKIVGTQTATGADAASVVQSILKAGSDTGAGTETSRLKIVSSDSGRGADRTSVRDPFTDVDGTDVASHQMTSGAGWTSLQGTWQISANRLVLAASAGDGQNVVVTNLGRANNRFSADVVAPAGDWNAGLVANAIDPNNYWLVQIGNGGILLWEHVAGGFDLRGSAGGLASGQTHRVSIETNGDTITFVANGALLISYTVAGRALKTEPLFGLRIHSSDTGSAFDNVDADWGIRQARTETATGIETAKVKLERADTATGVDSSLLRATPVRGETGTGTETAKITQRRSDTATGTETGGVVAQKTASDSGTGVETAQVQIAGGTLTIHKSDVATGVDSATLGVQAARSDQATGADVATPQVAQGRAEQGTGTEVATSARSSQRSDAATGVDRAIKNQFNTATDAASATEAARIKQARPDAGTGAEASTLSTTSRPSDNNSATVETAKITQQRAEAAAAVEAATIIIRSADAGSGVDASQALTAELARTDVGVGLDLVSYRRFALVEVGSGVEDRARMELLKGPLVAVPYRSSLTLTEAVHGSITSTEKVAP